MQEEIVALITDYGDFNEAVKWADSFNIPIDNRPHCIRESQQIVQRYDKYISILLKLSFFSLAYR
jgi:hypothetical protein